MARNQASNRHSNLIDEVLLSVGSIRDSQVSAQANGVTNISAQVFEPPQDDFDDDFTVEVDLAFEVSGPLLARMLGKQQRVLPKALKDVKGNSRKLIALLERPGPVAKEIRKALSPAIKRAVLDMARSEFGRGAIIDTWDFSEVQHNPAVIVRDGSVSYEVEASVLGTWK